MGGAGVGEECGSSSSSASGSCRCVGCGSSITTGAVRSSNTSRSVGVGQAGNPLLVKLWCTLELPRTLSNVAKSCGAFCYVREDPWGTMHHSTLKVPSFTPTCIWPWIAELECGDSDQGRGV